MVHHRTDVIWSHRRLAVSPSEFAVDIAAPAWLSFGRQAARTLVHNISNRKHIMSLVCSILGVLIFAYCYFIRAQKDWSWPIAVCLSLLWGLVVLWIFRQEDRGSVKTQNQKSNDDKTERA